MGAGYCVLRPPHPFRGAIFDCVFPRQLRLACSQPVARLPATLTSTTQLPVSYHSVRTWILRLPVREFRDPAMYGSLTSSAAAKFCNVHQRHSDFAASRRRKLSFKSLPSLECLPAIRTAKSGSRDAPCGAELDLLAQIRLMIGFTPAAIRFKTTVRRATAPNRNDYARPSASNPSKPATSLLRSRRLR